MNKYAGIKPKIERVHIQYLCNNFGIQKAPNFEGIAGDKFKPDFYAEGKEEKSLFELKSRIFLRGDKERSEVACGYWALDAFQISEYERISRENNMNLFWMFILAEIEKPLKQCKKISEKMFVNRDIYVVEWNSHRKLYLPPSGFKRMSLNILKKEHTFKDYAVLKGTLHLEQIVEAKLKKHFL